MFSIRGSEKVPKEVKFKLQDKVQRTHLGSIESKCFMEISEGEWDQVSWREAVLGDGRI